MPVAGGDPFTFSASPNAGRARVLARNDFSHNSFEAMKISADNNKLCKRLLEISSTTKPSPEFQNNMSVASAAIGKLAPGNVSAAGINRRKKEDSIAMENLAIYQRLQAVRPTSDVARDSLTKAFIQNKTYGNNVRKFRGLPGSTQETGAVSGRDGYSADSAEGGSGMKFAAEVAEEAAAAAAVAAATKRVVGKSPAAKSAAGAATGKAAAASSPKGAAAVKGKAAAAATGAAPAGPKLETAESVQVDASAESEPPAKEEAAPEANYEEGAEAAPAKEEAAPEPNYDEDETPGSPAAELVEE